MNGIVQIHLAGVVLLVTTTACAQSEIVFAPPISDFAVTFSGKPATQEFDAVTTDGSAIKGIRAELRAQGYFQRAEVIRLLPGFSSSETKESATAKMREYALHNGLQAPEFTWEVTPLGKRLSMRATKILDDDGKAKALTFEVIHYYGDSSLLAIYVAGSSDAYPPTAVVKFLKSVRKNEKQKESSK